MLKPSRAQQLTTSIHQRQKRTQVELVPLDVQEITGRPGDHRARPVHAVQELAKL